jgi:hypothetical protein
LSKRCQSCYIICCLDVSVIFVLLKGIVAKEKLLLDVFLKGLNFANSLNDLNGLNFLNALKGSNFAKTGIVCLL